MARISLGEMRIIGDPGLIPSLSDSYYLLLRDLIATSRRYPESIAYPAGCIIIAVACLESYINELIYISFSSSKPEKVVVKKQMDGYKTDFVRKIKELKAIAKLPEAIDDELIKDVEFLVGLRGKLVHYNPEAEHPNNDKIITKLEKLEKRLFGKNATPGLVTTERMLTTVTAEISEKIILEVTKKLYKSGYSPLRARWLETIDPDRHKAHPRR
jgi:hypothetical protein